MYGDAPVTESVEAAQPYGCAQLPTPASTETDSSGSFTDVIGYCSATLLPPDFVCHDVQHIFVGGHQVFCNDVYFYQASATINAITCP